MSIIRPWFLFDAVTGRGRSQACVESPMAQSCMPVRLLTCQANNVASPTLTSATLVPILVPVPGLRQHLPLETGVWRCSFVDRAVSIDIYTPRRHMHRALVQPWTALHSFHTSYRPVRCRNTIIAASKAVDISRLYQSNHRSRQNSSNSNTTDKMGIFSTEPKAARIDKYERLSDVTKVCTWDLREGRDLGVKP